MSSRIEKKPIFMLAFLISIFVFMGLKTSHGRKIPSDNQMMGREDVTQIVKKLDFTNIKDKYEIEDKIIKTHIDPFLQSKVEKELQKHSSLKYGKPVEIAVRAIDPENGNIILAANFDKDRPLNFTTLYPAASLFKIVSAAGVVDMLGYKPNTKLYFNGASHTLYKRQLTDRKNRYTNKTTLKRAFANSVNPVFGKIGNVLGKEKINYYSHIFGFENSVDSEFPCELGKVKEIKKKYHIAETASGFNRETIITPLFGSLISSSIINDGILYTPHLVDQITDLDGNLIYKSRPEIHKEILRGRTLKVLRQLMERTVKSGTARKAFRRARYDRQMKNLLIGGKTGSINSDDNKIRYDWFAGFAKDEKTNKTLAVSVLVMHGKYIGKRSADYAYFIIKNYFKAQRA